MKMKLAHKIVLGVGVLVVLSGIFSSMVFHAYFNQFAQLLSTPPPELQQLMDNAKKTSVSIGALTVILGVLIAFFLVKQIATPVKALNMALEAYLRDGKDLRVNIPNKDELGLLALYINRLLGEKKIRRGK